MKNLIKDQYELGLVKAKQIIRDAYSKVIISDEGVVILEEGKIGDISKIKLDFYKIFSSLVFHEFDIKTNSHQDYANLLSAKAKDYAMNSFKGTKKAKKESKKEWNNAIIIFYNFWFRDKLWSFASDVKEKYNPYNK